MHTLVRLSREMEAAGQARVKYLRVTPGIYFDFLKQKLLEYLYGKLRPKFDPENHILRVCKILLLVNGQLMRLRSRSFDIMKISNVVFI